MTLFLGSLGIAGVRKKNGGVGRAKPAQHPHIFTYIPANPNEPIFYDMLKLPVSVKKHL